MHIKFRYGYVTPDDVPELLDKHIGKGEIVERLWRLVFLWFSIFFLIAHLEPYHT